MASTMVLLPLSEHAEAKPRKAEHRSKGSHHREAMMEKELNLTSEQKAKIKQITERSRAKSKQVRANDSLSNDQKHTQMQHIRQERRRQIDATLTAPQRQKLAAIRKKRHKDHPAKR